MMSVCLLRACLVSILSSNDDCGYMLIMLDYVLCVLSIAVAAVYRPLQLISRLWPYLAILVSFVAFVIWNGGVVLGTAQSLTHHKQS